MKGKHWPTENQRNNAIINRNKGKCFIAHITIHAACTIPSKCAHNPKEPTWNVDGFAPTYFSPSSGQMQFSISLQKSWNTLHTIVGIRFSSNELPTSSVKWQVVNVGKRIEIDDANGESSAFSNNNKKSFTFAYKVWTLKIGRVGICSVSILSPFLFTSDPFKWRTSFGQMQWNGSTN